MGVALEQETERVVRMRFCRSAGQGMAVAALVFLLFPLLAARGGSAGQTVQRAHAEDGWRLVWSDEFNGPDGSSPDAGKWTVAVNGSGYNNNEQEYYTDRAVNVHVERGDLVLTAQKEEFTGPDGVRRGYTSGRLETRGHYELTYGRVEARIKLPRGQGLWPGFWMLGSSFGKEGWPACGEIDIMEQVGFEPSKVHGSLHGPGYFGATPLTGSYTLPDGARFDGGYHVFAAEWEPRVIRFYVDGTLYETQTAGDVPGAGKWAFDAPQFIVLNLAVGGYWPGMPDATTPLPATMRVDYVRVYQRNEENQQAQAQAAKR